MASDPKNEQDSLHAVIASRDLSVVFQPIVDLDDGEFTAFEALTRLGPGTGFAHTGDLFEKAAAAGMLWELEAVTRRASILAASDWPRDVRLFLNCAPVVFADARFQGALELALSETSGLSPARIVLEITELSDEQHLPGLLEQVRNLKAAGFDVAIDDAGAGASGLNRMMELRPNWIKLDREFVRGIDTDMYRQNLVRFFTNFAKHSGVRVIAEGIETAAELSTVVGVGVRFGQGFYLGMPSPREQCMSVEYTTGVRTNWAAVKTPTAIDPQGAPLAALCRRVASVQRESTVAEAAEALVASDELAGVVALDGRRVLGWAPRQLVLQAAEGLGAGRRIGELVGPGLCQIPPQSTVDEALQLACLLDDETVADPLLLASGGTVTGVVRLRDVLRLLAFEGRFAANWRASVTGLPARIRADQHLAEMIEKSSEPAHRMSRAFHADCAFIDLRSFADYNTTVGYELGDRLIRDVCDLINENVAAPLGDVFVSHLGDDRFLLTAHSGTLRPCLERLMAHFDRHSETLPTQSKDLAGRVRKCPRMSLRVLVMSEVFGRIEHVRDIYRLEMQLRQKARSEEARLPHPRSVLVNDQRWTPREARKSA